MVAFRMLEAGRPALGQLYENHNGLHIGDLGAERTSKADIGMDVYARTLRSRHIIAAGPDDVMLFPELEARVHRDLASYLRVTGASAINPNHVVGIPFPQSSRCFAAAAADLAQADPQAFKALINGATHVMPFIASEESRMVANTIQLGHDNTTQQAVDMANDKLAFKEAATRLRIPTAPYRNPKNLDQAVRDFWALQQVGKSDPSVFSGDVWIKLRRSCGGRGVHKVNNETDLVYWLRQYSERLNALSSEALYEGVILEAGLRPRALAASPNLNIFVADKPSNDIYVSGSVQKLAGGKEHAGNAGPIGKGHPDYEASYKILRQCANWLRSIGYRGPAGIDLLMHENGQVFVIEINARWNGSSPAGLAGIGFGDKPWAQSWVYGKAHAPKGTDVATVIRHLESTHINGSPIAFRPDKGGIAPINVAPSVFAERDDDSGYQFVAFANTEKAANELALAAEMH